MTESFDEAFAEGLARPCLEQVAVDANAEQRGAERLPLRLVASCPFNDDRGELFDWEEFSGQSIFLRYTWTRPMPTAARMVQLFSPDRGQTWEANWVCDLSLQA
ncbi:MAG: hypothetical protein ABIR54_12695 [Burkholderiaceae bacterium]